MRKSLVLLLLLSVAFSARALTIGEEAAIEALLRSNPSLEYQHPPWTTNTSQACESSPFYGLTCSEGPDAHVIGLRWKNYSKAVNLPEEIGELLWLENFHIEAHCLGRALPPSVGRLLNLTSFDLSDLHLLPCMREEFSLPDSICDLAQLRTLRVSLTQLRGSIPTNIGLLASLEHLSIDLVGQTYYDSNNNIHGTVPKSFWQLHRLKSLTLAYTGLNRFETPPIIGSFPDLERISFFQSEKLAVDLSVIFQSSLKLEFIDLSASSASFLRGSMDDLVSLSSLNLARNPIHWPIEETFWHNHPELVFLSLDNAQGITGTISPYISLLSKLTYLSLDASGISGTLPPNITDCPLETLVIRQTTMEHPIPSNIGDLNGTLTWFEMSDLAGTPTTLPDSIGALKRLKVFHARSNGLQGTFPSGLESAFDLNDFRVDRNNLTGSFPALQTTVPIFVDATNNHFSGSIPHSVAARASNLYLDFNAFEGEIEHDLFTSNSKLEWLALSNNRFSGCLPAFNTTNTPQIVDMSYNNFTCEIPSHYGDIKYLTLAFNKLVGNLSSLLSPGSDRNAIELRLGNNLLEGTIPDLSVSWGKLVTLSLANNRFSGRLFGLPKSLRTLNVSGNKFGMLWLDVSVVKGLKSLDLSRNGLFAYNAWHSLLGPGMTYLSLAYNTFLQNNFEPGLTQTYTALSVLDLTAISQVGPFPLDLFPSLSLLKIAHNSFSGPLRLGPNRQTLSQIDISGNRFRFELSSISSLPLLTTFNAQSNLLFGSLYLADLPSLQVVNLAGNELDFTLNLESLGELFAKTPLQVVNISHNPHLPRVASFSYASTGLARTSTSAPSVDYADSVICYELSFFNKSSGSFIYDESLFDYAQCDCNQDHFGLPPTKCLKCPSNDAVSCNATQASISNNTYAFVYIPKPKTLSPHASTWQSSDESWIPSITLITSIWTSLANSFGLDAQNAEMATRSNAFGGLEIETESCLVTTIQTLTLASNCRGVAVRSSDLLGSNVSLAKLLEPQCGEGSDGRLCSRCICDTGKDESCWFSSGPTCSKCRHVFSLSASIPLVVSILVVAIAVSSVIIGLVLDSKRRQSLKSFSSLPLHKRFFYRLLHLTTLGNLSIVITFLQMLIGITQWDVYARAEILGVLNGSSEKLGLVCLFPILADPMWALLFQLSLPFLALVALAICVALGSIVARILASRRRQSVEIESEAEIDTEHTQLLASATSPSDEIAVSFPSVALLSSLSITVIKFFYFGTALASHEYLFSTQQALTGHRYIQSKPWMRANEAWSLLKASVASILIFDFCIPALFIVICAVYRNRINEASVRMYFGSLFDAYNPRCFWWEIVSTLKKISVALILKAFAPNDALQSVLITTILCGTHMVQLSMGPWRRQSENFADSASSLILIAALLYTRPAHFLNASGTMWYIFSISVVFVVTSACIVVWLTVTSTTDYELRLRLRLASSPPKQDSEDVSGDEMVINGETRD